MIRALLRWRVMYRELYIRVTSTFATHFPLDHIENIDRMYEIWILFELLDFLRSKGYTINIVEFPREFNVSKSGESFSLHYEKRYLGWSSVAALPDFTIEKDGKLAAVLDAKNWFLEDKKEAIYKMLGYMNNLNCPVGMLFFPNKKQLANNPIHYSISGPGHYLDNCLFNCVLYPSANATDRSKNMENISKIFEILSRQEKSLDFEI